jgi:type I restriction enzyme M protein
MNEQTLVAKVWNLAHVLRDEGGSYQDYLTQISFLFFLQMDRERDRQGGELSPLPDEQRGTGWPACRASR